MKLYEQRVKLRVKNKLGEKYNFGVCVVFTRRGRFCKNNQSLRTRNIKMFIALNLTILQPSLVTTQTGP